MRGPAVHVPEQLAKRNIVFEIKNVAKRQDLLRMVVKHQEHAGEGQHDKQIKRDPAHAPGKPVAHRIAIDLCRMKMKEDVGENRERAITRVRTNVRDAKDRFPKLRVLRILVSLGLFNSPILERSTLFTHPFEETARLLADGQLLRFFLVRTFVHLFLSSVV